MREDGYILTMNTSINPFESSLIEDLNLKS